MLGQNQLCKNKTELSYVLPSHHLPPNPFSCYKSRNPWPCLAPQYVKLAPAAITAGLRTPWRVISYRKRWNSLSNEVTIWVGTLHPPSSQPSNNHSSCSHLYTFFIIMFCIWNALPFPSDQNITLHEELIQLWHYSSQKKNVVLIRHTVFLCVNISLSLIHGFLKWNFIYIYI